MSSCEIAINEACLPGGYFAIAEVVPESKTHLCDFTGWAHSGLPLVIEGDALTARVSEEDALKGYAYSKVVAVKANTYYAVRAAMRRDPKSWGYLRGTLNKSGHSAQSEPPTGGDWEVVAFGVRAAEKDTELLIELKSVQAGGAAVQVKDVALLELVEGYGQYWRVTLLNPEIPYRYATPLGVQLLGDKTGDCESTISSTNDLAAGETSTWFDMGKHM